MRYIMPPALGVALLFLLVPDAPAQAPKPRLVIEGMPADLAAIALSHDGKTLVSVSRGLDRERGWKRWGDFRVWDVRTGKEVASFQGHEDEVRSLALSPDGAALASAGGDGSVRLWSMADRKALRSLKVGGYGVAVAFSADGKQLGVASESTILICDAATGEVRTSSNFRGRLARRIFSPDLALLATPCHQDVDLLDASTGKIRRTLADHHGSASPLAFSADGKTLAVLVSRDDEGRGFFTEIVLWDVATGVERACLKDVGYCYQLAFGADGKRLVLSAEPKFRSEAYELRVIDAATGRSGPPLALKRTVRPYGLSVSGDGRTIAITGADGTVHIYDLP
jgi:WD40 repeat protein